MDLKSLSHFGRKNVPVRREEYEPFSFLRHEMNRLFDDFNRGFWSAPIESRFESFSPRVDVSETDKEIKITAELPGMDDKEIDISLNKDTLTIKGEKKEDKGRDYYRAERSYGSFSRTIPLPAEIDADKVNAEFSKGLLSVTIPKTAEAIKETKKIPIKAE